MGRKSPNHAPHRKTPVDHHHNHTRKRVAHVAADGDAYNTKVRAIDNQTIVKEVTNGTTTPTSESTQIESKEVANAVIIKDPLCDPDNPKSIQFSDISAAAFNIKGGIERTPCTRSNQLSKILGMELYFKKDFLQVTGSFKERGARYALLKLSKEQRAIGVIAASAGNHALALSYHGQQLGIPVTVVMPVIAPLMKISMCRQYGANVIVQGANLGVAKELALKMGHEKGFKYINGYDHPDILAGQGTLGLEVLEQVNNLDAIIVPVGGGGLIAGVALAVKTLNPTITVIGVEGESCPSFQTALSAGRLVPTPCTSTLADGLAVPTVGANAMATAKGLVDKMVSVSEESIALAILRLIEVEKAVVEGAGAVGLAALLSGKLPELAGKRVVCVLCGGNIDTTVLGRTIERGLATDGRLIHFEVVVSDRPGGIAELTALLSQMGASIKDIFHERAWLRTDVFSVRVKVICETRDREHACELENVLHSHYQDVNFNL